ncbi:MAG TPA: signal peptide peptidase SppA [Tepidisphaeraceae bacterium]|jgi:protease-4|nr:signal peptide peptidase SppA [Tepidisphaeraceae bacterium]
MKWWVLVLVVSVAGWAGSCLAITSASTRPSQNSASAATQPVNRFPTPAELMAKIKAAHTANKEQVEPRLPEVAYFDLSDPVAEKPADFSLFAEDQQTVTLRVLIDRLEKARKDADVRGVLLRLGDGTLNLSQAMELRDELNMLRQEGKRTFVYADAYDTSSYIAASGATDVCMMEGGEIMIPGVGFETMFAKGLLDKIGVKADYVQIGEYKGADEEFTRTDASDELKGQLNKLADSLYGQIIDTISTSRKLAPNDVKATVDEALIPGKLAKDRGLVDHLVDIGGLRDLMAKELGQTVDLVTDYGETDKDQVDLSSPFALFALLARKPHESTRPGIAVIYAEGVIVDGSSGDGMFSQSENIGSDTMREAIRSAEKDDKIDAVVIRIDSPGGSALASEAMWQAARRLSKTKPVIISVGSMAASGGYYLASSGDFIFADPTAIVGSIGVVGGKFVLKDLFTKIGLNTESFVRGKNADLFSSSTEWDNRQRQQVTHWMKQTYDQFTERVMTTRKGKIKDIDAVARGRIFSAQQAKDLGMVDRIGGIQDAIAYAARKANLKPGDYDVRVLPAPKTFADLLNGDTNGSDEDSVMRFSPKLSVEVAGWMDVLEPSIRHALGLELDELMLLQRRPVMLTSPVVFIVK